MVLWFFSEILGMIHSVALVNRISFVTMAYTFIAAWRADVPTEEEKEGDG